MSSLRPSDEASPAGPGQAGANVIAAWRTSSRATTYLIERLPAALWTAPVPGLPRRTVGTIAAHIHNSRCMWIKSLGARHGVPAPPRVDLRRVRPRELVRALEKSSEGIVRLIELGVAHGGRVPPAAWQNFPTDLEHFLGYFVAHEAHHRGQLLLLARQLGHRLPREVAAGVWQWTRLSRPHAPPAGRPGRRRRARGATPRAGARPPAPPGRGRPPRGA